MTTVTIDFETEAIEPRPKYPPKPVGVAIKFQGEPGHYYAFGHPTGNNASYDEALRALSEAYAAERIVFHNAKFDLAVAAKHFGLQPPPWQRVHDTMFLLFLNNPNSVTLGLKESAAELLSLPPDEQDAVKDWLFEHPPVPRLGKAKGGEKYWAKYIAMAPGDLVGQYAIGDVERTETLFLKLYDNIAQRGMLSAYEREMKLLYVLMEAEEHGIKVDVARLAEDVDRYTAAHAMASAMIVDQIGEVNIDSGPQLMEAMIRAGVVDEDSMLLTETGKPQTNKDALLHCCKDTRLLSLLKYRSQLSTCLRTFLEPWLAMASVTGGLIYTSWHQVKSPAGGGNIGTRTGRLSSTPNFQNLPKAFKDTGVAALPPLPLVRSYIVPFEGHVIIDRDYSQQEPRILGHFEGDLLMQQYRNDPWIDFHDAARAELAKVGLVYDRKVVKGINLGLLYGMGNAKLAEQNGIDIEEAKQLRGAILKLYPGLDAMYKEMQRRAKLNEPIRTWGQRQYYCEPPAMIDGRVVTFEYKMVNTLIQGSAADCTKEALVRYAAAKHPDARIILNVHDEIAVSCPADIAVSEMKVLRQAMESVEFDVPMLSEGSWSPDNLAALKDYDKKGLLVSQLAV